MKPKRATPQVRVLLGNAIAMGPGKAALLAAIERTGSISAAAREMRMSYRRAWTLVETMNKSFREPVVVSATGGAGGGGARITAFGRTVLARYRAMEERAAGAVARDMAEFAKLMKDDDGRTA
jgi:molybdate transport system regulatory protein